MLFLKKQDKISPKVDISREKIKKQGINVGTGKFGAHMMVNLTNDGPVTILLESRKEF